MNELLDAFRTEVAPAWQLRYGVGERRDDSGAVDHRIYWIKLQSSHVEERHAQILSMRCTQSELTRSLYAGGPALAEQIAWESIIENLRTALAQAPKDRYQSSTSDDHDPSTSADANLA